MNMINFCKDMGIAGWGKGHMLKSLCKFEEADGGLLSYNIRRVKPLQIAAVLFFLLASFSSFAEGTDYAEKTKQLIAVIQSDADLSQRSYACQQLGVFGGEEAVPVLAGLLDDKRLAANARTGLENIPCKSAAEALRSALGRLKGDLLIGVVNSIGTLRYAEAEEDLLKLVNDRESGVVAEALLAIGRIAGEKGVAALKKMLVEGDELSRSNAAAACLLAAESRLRDGKADDAISVYELIAKAEVSDNYRCAAVYGSFVARGAKAAPYIMEALGSDNISIRNAALMSIRKVPSDEIANAIVSKLPSAEPEMKVQLITALIDSYNDTAADAVRGYALDDDPLVRMAALRAMRIKGSPADVPVLVGLLLDPERDQEAGLAVAILSQLEGGEVDDRIIKSLGELKDAETRIKLMQVIGGRGTTAATTELLKQAADADSKVSIMAHRCLRVLAEGKDIPGLIRLVKTSTDQQREAAEGTLSRVIIRDGNVEKSGKDVLGEFKATENPDEKCSWLRVLISISYAKALPDVIKALKDENDKIATTAISHVGNWADSSPVDALLDVYENSTDQARKRGAIASAIRLISVASDARQKDDDTITAWYKRLNREARLVEDKRLLISGLGRLKNAESLHLLAPYLDDKDVQNETAIALVQIAPTLVEPAHNRVVRTLLEKIVSTVNNQHAINKAKEILGSMPALVMPEDISLFDGSSLKGWTARGTAIFTVEDGVIVGTQTDGKGGDLFTDEVWTDFDLRFSYRVKWPANTGIWFRDKYQFDILKFAKPVAFSGTLYMPGIPGKLFLATNTVEALEHRDDWNEGRVLAVGDHLQMWLNGTQVADVRDTTHTSGRIAIQVHAGNQFKGMRIEIRSMTIRPVEKQNMGCDDGESGDGCVQAAAEINAPAETLYGVETPELRRRAEVEAVLGKAPAPPAEASLRPLTILFAGGTKDHLPKTHSHDVLPKRWKVLLGGTGPGDEALTNLYRPQVEADRDLIAAGAPRVTALSTLEWPTEEQFAAADVIILYQHPRFLMDAKHRQQIEAFLNRGGGLVLVHYPLWHDSAALADLVGLAKGKGSRYKHKVITLKLPEKRHPIMHGLPDTFTIADEVFWNFQGDRSKVTALATSDEVVGDKVSAEPVIWAYERGKGRVVASTLGHFDWTFDDPFFRAILLRGIAWAAGESPYRFDQLILRGIPLKD